MPDGERATKKRAQRIDMNYFKRPHAFRRWRFWLSLSVPLLAVLWLVWHGVTGNQRVYSGGQMSPAHAVLATKCDACHFDKLIDDRFEVSTCGHRFCRPCVRQHVLSAMATEL